MIDDLRVGTTASKSLSMSTDSGGTEDRDKSVCTSTHTFRIPHASMQPTACRAGTHDVVKNPHGYSEASSRSPLIYARHYRPVAEQTIRRLLCQWSNMRWSMLHQRPTVSNAGWFHLRHIFGVPRIVIGPSSLPLAPSVAIAAGIERDGRCGG